MEEKQPRKRLSATALALAGLALCTPSVSVAVGIHNGWRNGLAVLFVLLALYGAGLALVVLLGEEK